MSHFIAAIFLGITLQALIANAQQCKCGVPGSSSPSSIKYPEVSGFTTASPGRWCWQVAIENEAGTPYCSGVLIDPSYVISPASCVHGTAAGAVFVRAGAFDLSANESSVQKLQVVDYFVHQGYLDANTKNDFNIAILKLHKPVDCNAAGTCLACLPPHGQNSLNTTQNCLVTTWNVRSTPANAPQRPLRERPAGVHGQLDCQTALRNDITIGNAFQLSDSRICLKEAQNISTCQGDIGDPLVCLNGGRYEVTGLNTIGFSCLRPNIPSFFVAVSSFTDWIVKLRDQMSTTRSPIPAGAPGVSTPSLADILAPITEPTVTTAVPVILTGPGNSNVQVHQSSGNSMQSIGADGSLSQVNGDGSVQTMQALTAQTNFMESMGQGIFKVNNGVIVPDLAALQAQAAGQADGPAKSIQKRQALGNETVEVPVVEIPESSVLYDSKTGKFVFNLPTGLQAFSSISFLPSTADDVKKQIVDQQAQILAQVENLKKNVLISVVDAFNNHGNNHGHNHNGEKVAPAPPVVQPVAVQTAAVQTPAVATAPATRAPFKWAASAKSATTTSSDDEESHEEAEATTPSGTGRTWRRATAAPSGGPGFVGQVLTASGNGIAGSMGSSVNSAVGSGSAAVGFQGNSVKAMTNSAPGRASSSVSVSS